MSDGAQLIEVIGIGPGHPDFVLPVAHKRAALCGALVGGMRALALFDTAGKAICKVTADLLAVKKFIEEQQSLGIKVGVLVSGDPGFYSLLPFLRQHFGADVLRVTPGISSLQEAFATLGMAWQEARWFSLHGREQGEWLEALHRGTTVGLLTSPGEAPQVARRILAEGISVKDWRVWTLSDLTYEEEAVAAWSLDQLAEAEGAFRNTVMVMKYVEE